MGIFGKVKQMLGIGTVKVTVSVPPYFSVTDTTITGVVDLLAKSDQEVVSVEVKFDELWTTGRGDEKKEKTFTLGTQKFPGFSMKAGETKKLEYAVPFTYAKSGNEEMAGKGGVMGGIGKLAKFADGEKSTFQIVATCDVKGTSLDPSDTQEVRRK